jgi:hypothetical protein
VNEEGHVTSQRGKAGCSKGEYGKKKKKNKKEEKKKKRK